MMIPVAASFKKGVFIPN